MPGILSKCQAKGVDFCGGKTNHFIIRADIGCYMTSAGFHLGEGNTITSLHINCQGGDHYFSDTTHWYIIKGNKYRCLTDIENDLGAEVFDLNEKFQGGDHYLVSYGYFYIIFKKTGKYFKTTSLADGCKDVSEHTLSSRCKDGLYFWGTSSYIYYVIQDEWGVQYCSTSDLSEDSRASTMPFHHDVLSFLPGGLAMLHGPAYRKWDLIKVISNDSDISVPWDMKIKWKVGYSRSNLSSVQHYWIMSPTSSLDLETLTKLIVKSQFSLELKYGGLGLSMENENWEEATENKETLKLTLEPEKKMYVWQYKLGFGKEDVLFCHGISVCNNSTPPTDTPLSKNTWCRQ